MNTSSTHRTDNPASSSIEELQGRMLLKRGSLALALEGGFQALPVVVAPSLEQLTVPAPKLEPLTGEDLLARFGELRRETAQRRALAHDEAVQEGDEVLLDVIGFARGGVIPFSARSGWRAVVEHEPLLPGLFEALVGRPAGTVVEVPLTLPADYPVEALREVPARFLVEVKAAYELIAPDEDSPECLKLLGRGATLGETMQRIGEELLDAREDEALHALREHVLALLVERSEVTVPEPLVDAEIRSKWMEVEQPVLLRLKRSPRELQEALQGWLRDPFTRGTARHRLKVALVLGAVAVRDGVQPSPKDLEELRESLMGTTPMSRSDWKQMLSSERALAQRVHNLLLHQATVNHVLAHVTVG